MTTAFQTYTINLPAGGAERVACTGRYFRLINVTGKVTMRGEFGALEGIGAGQGAKFDKDFTELQIRDVSGAANSVTFIVGSVEFIDQSFTLDQASKDTLRHPLVATGKWADMSGAVANTAMQVFAPASNVNGAIILTASSYDLAGAATLMGMAFIAKVSAPTSPTDGEVITHQKAYYHTGAAIFYSCELPCAQKIAAGLGLYFIQSVSGNTTGIHRAARYILL